MTLDEHTTNRPTPGGSAFQETGMDDYLTRVAEAVRDATLNKAWQIGNNGPLRSAIALQAVIASVPRPEPVAAQPAVPVGYDPKEIDNVFSTLRYVIGLNPGKKAPTAHCQDIIERVASWSDMGKFHPMYSQYRAAAADRAMLAAAPETPHVVDDQFELTCPEPPARDDRKAIKRLSEAVSAICAQAGESEDEFTKWLADGGMLELLESGNKAMKLEKAVEAAGQQNAALVALLVQCALAANTLRVDFEKYATHSGFNEEFVNAVCVAAGVPRDHGYGNAEYQSQRAALASAKGGAA